MTREEQTKRYIAAEFGSTSCDFERSTGELACSPAPQNLKFERADWSLFRTVEGLQQKAGVEKSKLRRLVLKELADNGLDENAKVRIGTGRWSRILRRGRRARD
jgi:hypothetical protein